MWADRGYMEQADEKKRIFADIEKYGVNAIPHEYLNKLKVVLIANKSTVINKLEYILDKRCNIKVSGIYQNIIDALGSVNEINPDIIFWDISKSEIIENNVVEETMKHIRYANIVFITDISKYAVKAFELNAADFILKPFSEERLKLTISKIVKRIINERLNNYSMDSYNQYSPKQSKISVWKDGRIFVLKPEEILYCCINGRNVHIAAERACYASNDSLNKWEDKLSSYNFFKCHRSYIVNMDHVREIHPYFNNTYGLKLASSTDEIPVSRGYSKQLKQLFGL